MYKYLKLLSTALFTILLCVLSPMVIQASDGFYTLHDDHGVEHYYFQDDTKQYYYTLKEDKAWIMRYVGKLSGTFYFPEKVDGYQVEGIGAFDIQVFEEATGDASGIVIPNGVTTVGDHAFYRRTALRQISLPISLRSIGAEAFTYCTKLEQVALPNNLNTLGEGAFYGCSSLKKVTVGSQLRSIKTKSFAGCINLVQAIIPKTVTNVAKDAFYGCSQLKKYTSNTGVPALNTVLVAPQMSLAKATTTTAKLKWNKVSLASQYEIFQSTSLNGKYKKVKTVSSKTTTCIIKKLSKKKRYYFKIRSIKKVGNKKSYSLYGTPVIHEKLKIKIGNGTNYGGSISGKYKTQLENALVELSSQCADSQYTAYDKLYYLQAFLQQKIRYSMSSSHFYDAWGALVNHKASCYGYSYATKAFCDQVGIPCKIVKPNAKAVNPNHLWNMVKVGGSWYMLDTNFNASSYYGWYAFLVSGDTYKNVTMGMKWDEKKYPKCSKDYGK